MPSPLDYEIKGSIGSSGPAYTIPITSCDEKKERKIKKKQ